MKNIIIEETEYMKYLLKYERGKVISEQEQTKFISPAESLCKYHNDCDSLLETEIENINYTKEKKYKLSSSKGFFEGVNSQGNQIQILIPKKGDENLTVLVNSEKKVFRLPSSLIGKDKNELIKLLS